MQWDWLRKVVPHYYPNSFLTLAKTQYQFKVAETSKIYDSWRHPKITIVPPTSSQPWLPHLLFSHWIKTIQRMLLYMWKMSSRRDCMVTKERKWREWLRCLSWLIQSKLTGVRGCFLLSLTTCCRSNVLPYYQEFGMLNSKQFKSMKALRGKFTVVDFIGFLWRVCKGRTEKYVSFPQAGAGLRFCLVSTNYFESLLTKAPNLFCEAQSSVLYQSWIYC